MRRKNSTAVDNSSTITNQSPLGNQDAESISSNSDSSFNKDDSTSDIEQGSIKPPTFKRSTTSISSTALSTMFYSQCALSGISSEDAENAISESRNWYHNWWRQQRFQSDEKEDNDSDDPSLPCPKKNRRFSNNGNTIETEEGSSHIIPDDDVESLKRQVLQSLRSCGGDVANPEFLKYVSMLSELYRSMTAEPEEKKDEEEGISFASGVWVTLNKPHFQECLGRDPDSGEYMYTLGRMSFDMFRKDLRCRVKGIYNIIEDAQDDLNNENFLLPNGLTKEDCIDQCIMTYNISVAFTIENTNLKAVMTNYGYMLPDPDIPNRFSIWFTRGILEQDPDNTSEDEIPTNEWKETFGDSMNNRTMSERAKLFAAKMMLGIKAPTQMEEDGSMEYNLYKPIRGYCDVMYMDDKLRIIKGHHGTYYVLYRIS